MYLGILDRTFFPQKAAALNYLWITNAAHCVVENSSLNSDFGVDENRPQ